ncbi:MAG TPA: hypothetical protein VM118_01640 [Acidobacteriota bacterium]|nr:hypothetical protein [Acidobacteriota bacterium]
MPFAFRWCIGLAGAVVFAAFWSGCAIDRGTEPAAIRDGVLRTTKLPAMNILDDWWP